VEWDHSLIPDQITDFKDLFCWIGDQMELDLFVSRDWREIDLVIENSDSAIAIHGSGFHGGRRCPWPKCKAGGVRRAERGLLPDRLAFSKRKEGIFRRWWNGPGGNCRRWTSCLRTLRTSSREVSLSRAQFARSDLGAAIRSFDFAFGLRRKGVGHIHTQQAQDLTPLRIDVIRSQDLLVPDAVPALDEAEDAQIIHVVLQRQSIGLHQALCGPDMGPGGLLGYEISI